jgi:hypothetical protein
MPAKNTATIISIVIPFCGDLELTPHSCLSKSFWSRLVILDLPWQEMTDFGQRIAGYSCSLSRVCSNAGHFKNHFWRNEP